MKAQKMHLADGNFMLMTESDFDILITFMKLMRNKDKFEFINQYPHHSRTFSIDERVVIHNFLESNGYTDI